MWKLLIDDSSVLANHIEKSHFRSSCWNLHKILKCQTISVTLIERFFSEESIILEFRKGKENDIKKQTNKNLSDSCNLWWSPNPKVAKGEKKNHQNGLMVERKEGGLCPFLGAQSYSQRALQLDSITKSSSTHTRWRFSLQRVCLPLSSESLYSGTTELTVI